MTTILVIMLFMKYFCNYLIIKTDFNQQIIPKFCDYKCLIVTYVNGYVCINSSLDLKLFRNIQYNIINDGYMHMNKSFFVRN